ncbi:MAG: dephospho-CoA kinase [Salibacteraceae bacterium]
MKVVGLTGGIGAGKSFVANIFKTLGIPVYDSDSRAKQLYFDNEELKIKMKSHFGEDIYHGNEIDRGKLASIVFNNKEKLNLLNALVHPLLIQDFIAWKIKQSTPYVVREAAILIESNGYRDCNSIIVVTAPTDLKIARVISRDKSTKEQVNQRIANQISDPERLKFADFEIINDGSSSVIQQVLKIHQKLIN